MNVQTEMMTPDKIVKNAFRCSFMPPNYERIVGERMAEAAKRDRKLRGLASPDAPMRDESQERKIIRAEERSRDLFAATQDKLGAEFTVAELAEIIKRPRQSASSVVTSWHKHGLVKKVRQIPMTYRSRGGMNKVTVWGVV